MCLVPPNTLLLTSKIVLKLKSLKSTSALSPNLNILK